MPQISGEDRAKWSPDKDRRLINAAQERPSQNPDAQLYGLLNRALCILGASLLPGCALPDTVTLLL